MEGKLLPDELQREAFENVDLMQQGETIKNPSGYSVIGAQGASVSARYPKLGDTLEAHGITKRAP